MLSRIQFMILTSIINESLNSHNEKTPLETGNKFQGAPCPALPYMLFLLFDSVGSTLLKCYLLRPIQDVT